MEWNRPARPAQPAGQPAAPSVGAPVSHHNGGKRQKRGILPGRLVTVILLFAITGLMVALISFLMLTKGGDENKYVKDDKLQAVFLNGGQVYFGHISSLNSQYMTVRNIYYLRVNQQVQPDQKDQKTQQQDISLVKLGCELHGPEDEMVINREQVIFWENLKSDGQVTKAVEEYVKANPEGQKCQANQQTSNPATPSPTTPTPTPTPSTNNR